MGLPAPHDRELLGGYVLGALDGVESRRVAEHLAECEACREELAELTALAPLLELLPAEAFADSPQRTIRWPGRVAVLAAVLLLAIGVGTGVLIGQGSAPIAAPSAVGPSSTPAPTPSGGRSGMGTGPGGTRLSVRLEPAAGWVRVHVYAAGVTAGEHCRVVVVSRTGDREVAASWLVSPNGEKNGTSLDGAAVIAPDDVVAVEIDTFDGRRLVSTPL
jgi:anti-sigma factor RsiW